jgi:hypothetical protein
MATTTPNYGWTVPTSTDLVKDGATAIETLGDAIDASMNTALGTKKAGMVLLNTTSFSGVASQSISDVFSTNYANYLCIVNLDLSISSQGLEARLRVSGSDNSSANYVWQKTSSNQSNAVVVGSSGNSAAATSWNIASISGTHSTFTKIHFFNPFVTDNTSFCAESHYFDSFANQATSTAGGSTTVTTSYTGFTLIPSGGNITGTARIYGYN